MKKLVLFLLLSLLLLCSASVGYCSGTLTEQDGFETYMGKSKSIVRIISPYYQETADGKTYLVDSLTTGNDGFLGLVVNFDENDVVNCVNIQMDPDTVKRDYDGDIYKVFSFSIFALGLDSADILGIKEDEDGLWALLKGSIGCVCTHTENFYYVSCINMTE